MNIVRKPEQVAVLKAIGAQLRQQLCQLPAGSHRSARRHRATLAFDATGGGRLAGWRAGGLAGQILGCMEAALNQTAKEYSRYGSTTHKQVYLYGGLDTRPTEFIRNFRMAWGMGGWLLFPFLQKIGPEAALELKQRVAAELRTTFASHCAGELSLAEALQPDWIALYGQRATGAKYLMNPNKGLT